uniref:Uncharacterized protein n=1 Tax=Acrobeloides nanus TaxID=290746 RepID=A0A914DQ44_9BILA
MNGQNTNLDLRGIGTYVSASTSTVGDNSPIAMKVDQENTANVQNGSAVKEPAETLAQRAPVENETNLLVLNELMQRALQLEANKFFSA